MKNFVERYNVLNKNLLQKFLEMCDEENVVYSAYSIVTLLAVAAQATSSDTRGEILKAVAKEMTYEELENALKELGGKLKENEDVISANATIVRREIEKSILPDYSERLKASFDGDLVVSQNIVKDTNAWVSEKTNGRIMKVADDFMSDMLVCLINAILFEAEWKDEYEEEDIFENGMFTNADGSISDVTMLSSVEWNYLENEYFTGFAKPYKNSFSYVALLPKKKKSRHFLMRAVEQTDITELFRSCSNEEVWVDMPEFTVDFEGKLNGICKDIGIDRLFDSAADFSNMSSEDLKMNAIIHKAKIEVDRKGTKAVAVTEGLVGAGCPPMKDHHTVTLDRPFLYAIVHNETGIPVFTGMVNKL